MGGKQTTALTAFVDKKDVLTWETTGCAKVLNNLSNDHDYDT